MTALVSLGRLGPALQSIRTIPPTAAGYEPEASALFARFTTPPTAARKRVINNLYRALKYSAAGNLLLLLDALWIRAAADVQASQRNWIGNVYNLTDFSQTFTADRGSAGNGSSGFSNPGYNPSTAGGKLTQNSATLAVWSLTDSAANVTDIGCGVSGDHLRMDVRRAADASVFAINQDPATPMAPTMTSSTGLLIASRTGANTTKVRRNKTEVATGTGASVGLPNFNLTIGAFGGSSQFSARQYAMAAIGAGMTDAECNALYDAVQPYLAAVGAI